jgi:hypothetical protein
MMGAAGYSTSTPRHSMLGQVPTGSPGMETRHQ